MKRVILFMGIVFFWLQLALFSEEISFTARFSHQEISINDRVDYELIIKGKDVNSIPEPKLPNFQGKFDILAPSETTSISWVNGKVTVSKIKKYTLMPVAKGEFVIDPAEVAFKGKRYRTDSLKINVVSANVNIAISGAPSSGPAQTHQHPLSGLSGLDRFFKHDNFFNKEKIQGNIFVNARVDKTQVFVGEQILFTLDFFRRIRLWSNISFEAPEFRGFWVDDLKTQETHEKKLVESRWFYKFELLKKAIFALEPGEIVIPQAKVGFIVNPWDGQRILSSNPIAMQVLPLPEEGKPKNFSGAVGEFSLEAEVDKTQVQQNSPISLKITLAGEGNLRSISGLNFQEIPSLKVYKSKVDDKISFINRIEGERIFEYVVIPKNAGKLVIPSFIFSYFSPNERMYKILKTEPINITAALENEKDARVVGGVSAKQAVEVLKKDITYLKTPVRDIGYEYINNKYWFWFIILVESLLLLTAVLLLIKKGIKKDIKKEKRQKAFDIALKRIKPYLNEVKSNVKVMSQVQNVFLDFLSNKTGHSFLGLTGKEMRSVLEKGQFRLEHIKNITALLERLDFSIYAPSRSSEKERMALCKEIVKMITELKNW